MKNTDGSDRLSSLHDSILSHILGFLDMKQVVHTSLLSKRWKYVWKSVSNLNFDHSFWQKTACPLGDVHLFMLPYWAAPPIHELKIGFMDFVYHILSIHEGSVINKFNLDGADYCQKDRIDEWLSTVLRCGVQEIHLDLYSALPQFFFPSIAHLKKLHLTSIQLPDCTSEGEIMLDCPVLETLILRSCWCGHNPPIVFFISAPQLRKLVCRSVHISCIINIFAPNLMLLECIGCMTKLHHMGTSSEVLRVTIASQRTTAQELLELLKGLKYATTLDISNCWLSVSNTSDDKSTTMEKLDLEEPLEFMVQELKIQNLQGNDNEFMVLVILFRHAPYLETVDITTTRARKSAIRKPLAKFGKKLHSLPKASTSVGIKFVVKTRM